MGKITGIMIGNYGPLRDVTLGDFLPDDTSNELGNVVALIGPNGSGKSSIADAFGFLADCISSDVESACENNNRGGFDQLASKSIDSDDTISFTICFKENDVHFPIIYGLNIRKDENSRPCIKAEFLFYKLPKNKKMNVMAFGDGFGYAVDGELVGGKNAKEKLSVRAQNTIELSDTRTPAIVTLGKMAQYGIITRFLDFMKSWFLCYFSPGAARRHQNVNPTPYLNSNGDNLNNVAQYMYRENPEEFKKILAGIQQKIPDIERIEPIQMINGQMELAFYQRGFEQPFFSSRMSDGTLKLFAYYLMLHEKNPRQLIFIEEPENGLYHHYLTDLAYEMKKSAGTGYNKQIFVTTHSPFFVNALSPEQVWVLEKGEDGFTTAKRASEYPFVKEMAEEGVSMGDLWYSKYFG